MYVQLTVTPKTVIQKVVSKWKISKSEEKKLYLLTYLDHLIDNTESIDHEFTYGGALNNDENNNHKFEKKSF